MTVSKKLKKEKVLKFYKSITKSTKQHHNKVKWDDANLSNASVKSTDVDINLYCFFTRDRNIDSTTYDSGTKTRNSTSSFKNHQQTDQDILGQKKGRSYIKQTSINSNVITIKLFEHANTLPIKGSKSSVRQTLLSRVINVITTNFFTLIKWEIFTTSITSFFNKTKNKSKNKTKT